MVVEKFLVESSTWHTFARVLLQASLGFMVLAAWERVRVRWLLLQRPRTPLIDECPCFGVLRYGGAALVGYLLLGASLAVAAWMLPQQRLLAGVLCLICVGTAARCHFSEVKFDEEAIERWMFGQRIQRLSWSQLRRVQAQHGTLALVEDCGPALQVHYSRSGFPALCAAVLNRAGRKALLSGEASALILSWANLSHPHLVSLYGRRFVADPLMHGCLWDPDLDPYEGWRIVATTLGQRLYRSLGAVPPFVIDLDTQGRAKVRPWEVNEALDASTWATCRFEKGRLHVAVDFESNGIRKYPVPV